MVSTQHITSLTAGGSSSHDLGGVSGTILQSAVQGNQSLPLKSFHKSHCSGA